ncbi:MAG TPA: hypothetical protein PK598_12905 [Thermoanaerobaculia bacterium]|nr:hypothetical protein [Thermoanaerobaculia bacterium]
MRRATSGTSLLGALVALSILGIALTMGAGFLARRRDLDRERLDRERALRAVRSEWVFLRTAARSEFLPAHERGFFGPPEFVDGLAERTPRLGLKPGPHPDLWFARLDLGYGRHGRRLVEEGWVFAGGWP